MPSSGALSGVRILDLSRVLAGPWATQIFGDFGADVIKVEKFGVGDDTRHWGPPYFGQMSSYFACTNRNKRSVAIDFAKEGDLQIIHRLLAEADVVIENFKPGALKKFGLDYEVLKSQYPNLIYCTISGFSTEGPNRDKPGYDALIQAVSGLMSITGPDDQQPTKVGVAVTDLLTGLYSSSAILAALYQRQHSGRGQAIEVSLFHTQVACLANVVMGYLATQKTPQPLGNAHPSIVPYRTFAAADKLLMIAIGNDGQFANFCQTLKVNWHQEAKFSTNPERVKHRTELEGLIQRELVKESRQHWMETFSGQGFPFGPVQDLSDVFQDPEVLTTGILTTMSDGKMPCISNPVRFSETPITRYSTPPELNEDPNIDWLKS